MKARLLKWFRRLLLNQVKAEQKRLMAVWPADFYQRGKWTGILNALGESGSQAKQTFRECMNWYLFGLRYVRACARELKPRQSNTNGVTLPGKGDQDGKQN